MQRKGLSTLFIMISLVLLVTLAEVSLAKSDDENIMGSPSLGSALANLNVNDNATTEKDNETDQIIGGNVVKNGYDFMVQLYDKNWNFGCSASLIAPGRVLTAAHCVLENASDPKSPKQKTINVIINSKTLLYRNSKLEANHLKSSASGSNIIVHPWFSTYNGQYGDLAVLKLDNPFDSTKVRSTYWNQYDTEYETYSPVVAAGWGQTESGGVSTILKSISLTKQSKCRAFSFYHLCTNYENGGICFGDSGGALLSTEWQVQIGINSFVENQKCNGYSYYTRVFAYKDWIANPTESLI